MVWARISPGRAKIRCRSPARSTTIRVVADRSDAEAFGLNLVSDGRHVVLNAEATGMAAKVRAAGYVPVPVELSELKRGGGSVKCAVAELRPRPLTP